MANENSFMFSARVSPPKPPEPPDKNHPPPVRSSNPKVSFRDKVLGRSPVQQMEKRDLLKEDIVRVDYKGGNKLLPKFYIANEYLQHLYQPWKDALILKLLGKSVGFRLMQDRLKNIWKLNGGFELRDIGHGFYMVKFDVEEDRWKVISGGPWMVFDHYLTVRTWSPDFVGDGSLYW